MDPIAVSWAPDPQRAVWMATIVPGLGQIYNRSYWKLPIVYGAFFGCGYAIVTNQTSYNEYKRAYLDLYNDNLNGVVSDAPERSYNAILPDGYDIERMGGTAQYITKLQNWQNTYRRYRDISIVVTVVAYALSIIDAYVDAQLFTFDISTDLSMTVEPEIYYNPTLRQTNGEMHLAIKF